MVAFALSLTLPVSFFLQRKTSILNPVPSIQGFIEDNAVVSEEDDHFKRKATAVEIARLIRLTNNQKSFAIGILGEYGSGKTSFMNLINLELDSKEALKISFDPWSAGNPENLRKEFFDLMARNIAEVDRKISSLIYSYGRKLASFNDYSLSALNWLNFFSNQGSAQSSGEFQQIDKMLRRLDRKIVITIDDLDRLYPAEILEVLKLIRNTGSFPNVFYLVGYDRSYIQEALKKQNEAGGLDYLDKIFQLEIPLPKREEDDLLITLQQHLRRMISSEHYAVFENVMIPNGFRSRYEKAYSSVLRQGRDVVRFVNGFKIIYELIGSEVDFQCLLILELIKFRFPSIYDLIYTQSDLFLYESPVRSTHEQYYSPRMIKQKSSDKMPDDLSVFKTHIEQFNWLNPEDVSLLDGLFMTLFKGRTYSRPEAKNSISYPLYFEIYFRYRLSHSDLSDKDFKAASTSGNMQAYMAYCANHNLHKELMIRLMQEDISKDRYRFEEVIRWIFSFGRTYVAKEGCYKFDYESLVDKIYNYHDMITGQLYKNDSRSYPDFIKHLFSTGIPPFLFENELIYHLKKKGDRFVVPLNELINHQLSYFTRMAESSHGLSKETNLLFWGARKHFMEPASGGGYHERWCFEPLLVAKMKAYLVSKDPKEFIKSSINFDIRDRSKTSIVRQVLDMFDQPSELRELIAANPSLDDTVKVEYLELFDKLSAKDFKEYVDIEFSTDLKWVDNGGVE
ncbi:KAP family P-loop domain-containing protein [Mucilaginibacter gossypiicola]|uniref:KAP family P-loop domain-containing protein n=2 Tax=Mucilaginibacter gossypiicola TaxID=551995 RepID=A0A1H8SZ77_9SPHI|nr:KAP family P-loop domain-containing protein [Mucilaginibacter gossypiicola]